MHHFLPCPSTFDLPLREALEATLKRLSPVLFSALLTASVTLVSRGQGSLSAPLKSGAAPREQRIAHAAEARREHLVPQRRDCHMHPDLAKRFTAPSSSSSSPPRRARPRARRAARSS